MTIALKISEGSKDFSDVVALDSVDIQLNAGEIVGLIGQNGSGKSTLLKIIAGLYNLDRGQMHLHGHKISLSSITEATNAGIGMVHQEQSLIPKLTVAENIFLDKKTDFVRYGIYDWKRLAAAAQRQLEKVELDINPMMLVEALDFSKRQLVELAKVLALEETTDGNLIVLFDEPTSVLSKLEIDRLFHQIRRLRHRASIIFVSHRMDEVLGISDRVYVLADGRVVAERETSKTNAEDLVGLLAGKNSQLKDTAIVTMSHEKLLELDGLRIRGRLHSTDLTISKGQIVGLIGVHGSGAEHLCRALFGLEEFECNTMKLNGIPIKISDPATAVGYGIAYVPAERKTEGIVQGQTVLQNMTLTFGLQHGYLGVIANHFKERQLAERWARELRIKVPSLDEPIERLSGGNQQKVAISKWLMGKCLRVLILDHPTRGLDPGAKADLFSAVRVLAEQGVGILFVGDTIEELFELAQTILVLRDGKIAKRFENVNIRPPGEADVLRALL